MHHFLVKPYSDSVFSHINITLDSAVHLLWSCMCVSLFIFCLKWFMLALLVKWEVARFLFFILILCSYFAFERTTHWARRREILFGILMGFSWENCPQNRPLHRCLCFRSAVLRVREGVRYNPVWRNLKYTSNFCFDVSLRTLEVERFFFFSHTEYCFYYTIKSTGTATFIMSHSSVSTLQP